MKLRTATQTSTPARELSFSLLWYKADLEGFNFGTAGRGRISSRGPKWTESGVTERQSESAREYFGCCGQSDHGAIHDELNRQFVVVGQPDEFHDLREPGGSDRSGSGRSG